VPARAPVRFGWPALLALGAAAARAMIFLGTDDPAHNTTPPAGELAESGWQWQGNWRGFAGTPVAPQWFLTARHLGGSVGEEFHFAGRAWRTIARFDDEESDLALWQVCGEFPAYAPLYGDTNEVGQPCVLFGRGRARGAPVVVTNELGETQLRGWLWGGGAGTLRWGVNHIAALANYGGHPENALAGTFDAAGEPDEAMLTGGDSGGGVFIRRDGRWELAGIALAVDGPFRFSADGEDIYAALFDKTGLFERGDSGWALVEATEAPQPAAWYASRIAARRDWIETIIATHSNPADPPELQMAADVAGPYTNVVAGVDPDAQTLRVPAPDGPAFFRLSACRPTRVRGITREGGDLVIRYE
jgi:hypothetical protein